MKRIIGVITVVALTAGILWAQTEKKEASEIKGATVEKRVERPAEARDPRPKPVDTRLLETGPGRAVPPRGMPPEMMRPPMQQNQVMVVQEQLAARQREFETYKAELNAIRKIAQQEKAKKTVEHIDKLLEKKEKEFAAEQKGSQDRVKQMQDQMDRIAKERALRLERQKEASTSAPDKKVQPSNK